ncbi:MAG: putative oxidoreductase C-terminal domain-containing protein [Balneolaceae bacterium]|nr:putative oxidoreductase C-terminal domain-containing protein [Balneolaceae bacterium]MDR9408778.1 putative oxidoreductase C-terminal domain-containing protein [Balneolaceae bacterium]
MESSQQDNTVRLMTLNPGHFHAGLVQMNQYPEVDSVVHVYAPEGEELQAYLSMIDQFNTREENPTNWHQEVYRGDDYLGKMVEEKPGNVMVVAGNNARKIEYITTAINNGINVLADKPMIIKPDQFSTLKTALETADEEGLVVNDIMTERHAITTILQKELSQIPELFGELEKGTPENPAIVKESVHFFYKTVAGETLVRPAWFFDVDQQGEAIVDVSTHLVDMILWQLFPNEPIDYRDQENGIEVSHANVWDTELRQSQFELITKQPEFPGYLMAEVESDSVLHVTSNGEFVFKVRDLFAKVSVAWGFTNPEGGDTHYSSLRGTNANLVIRQNVEQSFQATLYVEPVREPDSEEFEEDINNALTELNDRFPGLSAVSTPFGWKIQIPDEFNESHEEHFTRVMENYLEDLQAGALSDWERTNLLTKYYITTRAYEKSHN